MSQTKLEALAVKGVDIDPMDLLSIPNADYAVDRFDELYQIVRRWFPGASSGPEKPVSQHLPLYAVIYLRVDARSEPASLEQVTDALHDEARAALINFTPGALVREVDLAMDSIPHKDAVMIRVRMGVEHLA